MLKSLAHILFSIVPANADLEEERTSHQIPAITAIDEALTEYCPELLESNNSDQRDAINMPLQSPSCGQITPLSYAVIMGPQESHKFIPNTKALVAKLLGMGANPFIFTDNDAVYAQETSFEIVKKQYEALLGNTQYHPKTATTLQAIGRALAEYKRLALQLRNQKGIPLKICHLILCAADFGLDSEKQTQ